jgi:plasmid rolling circle replication initiator protein Rep
MTAAQTAPPAPPGTLPDPLERFSKHKRFTRPVSTSLGRDPELRDVAAAIGSCAQVLDLLVEAPPDGELYAHLKASQVCNRRLCPWCEWRRSQRWKRRIEAGLHALNVANPGHRPLLLTLTVRNCEIEELGQTISAMHKAWDRMVRRQFFPTDLWLRRTEVTYPNRLQSPSDPSQQRRAVPNRQTDTPQHTLSRGEVLGGRWAHPHLHALLMVRPSYWGKNYVKSLTWQQEWMDAARIDYPPVVDVRAITAAASRRWDGNVNRAAAMEVAKYVTKATDYCAIADSLPEIHRQLAHHRLIGCSAPMRAFISDAEPQGEEMTDQPLHLRSPESTLTPARATWKAFVQEYWLTPAEGAA